MKNHNFATVLKLKGMRFPRNLPILNPSLKMEGLLKPIEMIYPINLCACLFNGFFKVLIYIFVLYISVSGYHLNAQTPSGFIDSLAESCLKSFNVAGAAIAVVQDGKVIHSKGYGYKNIQSKEPVNDHNQLRHRFQHQSFYSRGTCDT
jgi:hypothetical protein